MTEEETLIVARQATQECKEIEREIYRLCARLRYLRNQRKAYIKTIQNALNYDIRENQRAS